MNKPINVTAGAAVGQYRLVQNSSGDAIVTTAASDLPIGCSQADAADSGEDFPMTLSGCRVKLTASAAIAKHAQIMPAAAGKIATFVSSTGNYLVGYALEAAAADGDVIECLLQIEQIAEV